ncbi:acetylxylan esterase [Auraticoccus monumenti]|uniref:Cephalosporin-C deacetylase n=1 Tax=Auraticoccus monumenti TaxID=675864 RepID=A0A1G6WFC1_9ACTN|nr:acetylxylan esterase [Auraticoccus monumenti]SDD64531.1 cephalosporin-C deacetylase [Auraticoccus monumenti]
MYTDMPLAALREHRSTVQTPEDFEEFWTSTLASARAAARPAEVRPVATVLRDVTVLDVELSGFAGDRVRGWLLLPPGAGPEAPVPGVVEYLGYGAGRGNPLEHLSVTAAGYAHLVMDTRGQGAGRLQGPGVTGDPHPSGPAYPGVLTRGIESPESCYYRRLFTDAVLAVDVLADHPAVDATRLAVQGGSQGGATAQAVAALRDDLTACFAWVPFLSDVARAITITDQTPYVELARYLSSQRTMVEAVTRTLAYVDGVVFASTSRTPTWYSVGLMDPVCPPSTVFASHNAHPGPKEIAVWPFNGHEGGGVEDRAAALTVLAGLFAR